MYLILGGKAAALLGSLSYAGGLRAPLKPGRYPCVLLLDPLVMFVGLHVLPCAYRTTYACARVPYRARIAPRAVAARAVVSTKALPCAVRTRAHAYINLGSHPGVRGASKPVTELFFEP